MKKHAAFLLSISVIILFTACNSMSFSNESPHTDLAATSEATISIKENSIGDTSLILLIENNTSKELSYDMTYALEQKKAGTWYSLNKDMVFNALAAILEPDTVNEFQVTWDAKLSKGLYRIVKPIATTDETSYIGVEFSID